jgi:hypothetical protein
MTTPRQAAAAERAIRRLETQRAAGLPPWLDRCAARVVARLSAKLPPRLVDGKGA